MEVEAPRPEGPTSGIPPLSYWLSNQQRLKSLAKSGEPSSPAGTHHHRPQKPLPIIWSLRLNMVSLHSEHDHSWRPNSLGHQPLT